MESYNRLLIEFLLSFSFFVFISCTGIERKTVSEVSLVETSDTVSFNLTPDVSTYNHTFQVFTDTGGSEYATFLNRKSSQIFVYDIAGGDPVKVIAYQKEGPNGLGTVYSHYMKSWNEFIIAGPRSIVYFLDSCGITQKKLDYTQDENVLGFNCWAYDPIVIRGDTLYCYQPSRRSANFTLLRESPTEIAINMDTKEYVQSPDLESEEIKDYKEGKDVSRTEVTSRFKCFNGKSLVYSFSYNEDLVVMSLDFKDITYKKAASRYIDNFKIPDYPKDMDFDEGLRQFCTNPYYGRIVYDPYRKFYYRFAYPETELENKKESWYDLSQSGRNEFSIIVLDDDLNVIGETKFPRNTFRSNLYFVCKDGFYISCNHYKNPGYTEDMLQFVRFEVKKDIP